MTLSRYNLASLVPRNLYASQVRKILIELRDEIPQFEARDFEHYRLGALLLDLARRHSITVADLFGVLRVVFAWPNTTLDVLAAMQKLGQPASIRCLDTAITMLSDVAVQ